MLSTCTIGQFTCDNGVCIDIVKRCDQTEDCTDNSDEELCSVVHVPRGSRHNRHIPPFSYGDDAKRYDDYTYLVIDNLIFSIIPISVDISITIQSIENIEEVRMSFSAKFSVIITWFDHRLTFKNLHENRFLNIPSQSDIRKLWVPFLIFDNTEDNSETVVDKKARIYVNRLGNYTLSSDNEMEETAYYKGSENSLRYFRTYYHRFKCKFQLHNYPFDTQTCKMFLRIPEKQQEFLNFIPGQLLYLGNHDIAEFFISHYEMVGTKVDSSSNIEISIVMKRRVPKHLLTIYMPSLCILIIAQVRNFLFAL